MEHLTITELQKMADDVAAKKEAVPFERLSHALYCYNNFVGNIKARLSEVHTIEDFYDFRKEWQSSLIVLNLPAQITQFHDYLAAAEQLNAAILRTVQTVGEPEGLSKKEYYDAIGLMHTLDETCIEILRDSETLYAHPFNKDHLRRCLTGSATKRAVYVHLLAVCEYAQIAQMVANKEIKVETIQGLPLAITPRECSLAAGDAQADALARYYKNLQALYKDQNLCLPAPVVFKEEPLKGVTFDGRDQKLRYFIGQAKRDFSRIVLTAERYEYTPAGGAPEPAIRVLAAIPGVCKPVDVGNLDRNLANRLGTYYADADIALEVTDLDTFTTSEGESTPFMRILVTVGERAKPFVKEQTVDLSEELEDMFNMEELK